MVNIMPLIKTLAAEGIVKSLSSSRSIFVGWGLYTAAIIPAGIGLAFLAYSEFFFLNTRLSPGLSAMLTALSCFLLAVLIFGTGYFFIKKDKARRHSNNREIVEAVQAFIEGIGDDLEDPIRENPKTAVIIASLAGYLTGDNIPYRH